MSPDSDAVANAGFVIMDRSVLVFDTHFTPEAGRSLLREIRSITLKPIRYVVNSHAHADHTHGNQVFKNAQLIGSSIARREVLEIDLPSSERAIKITEKQLEKLRGDAKNAQDESQVRRIQAQILPREEWLRTMSRLEIMAPFVTLDDNLTIRDGKQEVWIAYLGVGHTEGDVILYLPSQKIAFAGDLFFNRAIPNVQDANILKWMETLREVLKLDAGTFVPGHGPVGSKEDVRAFLTYLEELKAMVQPCVDRGDPVEEVVRNLQVPVKYSSYMFQNFFPANIQKMYTELKEVQLLEKRLEEEAEAEEEKYLRKSKAPGKVPHKD